MSKFELPFYLGQLLASRDVSGKPFAFVPLLCRLFSLSEREFTSVSQNQSQAIGDQSFLSHVRQLPDIEHSLLEEIEENGVEGMLRKHTPGIALIVTQSCNLGCSYCLAKQGTFGLPVAAMKLDEIKRRIESLFESQPNIDFMKFFGGEPTLRIDLIDDVCRFVTEELGKTIHFALTTNGTLKADRHIDIWRKYHISVSVSVDGPEDVHDAVRTRGDGRGSFRDAVNYCETLKDYNFPYAVVGVFDRRHQLAGLSYLDNIKFLNKLSALTKVQFVEALGSVARDTQINDFCRDTVTTQIHQAVDAILLSATNKWQVPDSPEWVYDNNLLRFIYGVASEKARPYTHACTASHLTTLFPSGKTMACYTFSERPELSFGDKETANLLIETGRKVFQDTHTWNYLAQAGTTVPWYRGVVGDICVADMMNASANDRNLESSPFYKNFQEQAVLRILQHLPAIAGDGIKTARLLHTLEHHREITGEYTKKMLRETVGNI